MQDYEDRLNLENYGPLLKWWLEERRMSITALAAATGRTRQAIQDLIAGRSRPPLETHILICRALDIGIEDFFTPVLESILATNREERNA